MKILLIGNYPYLYSKSMDKYANLLYDKLTERGHIVRLLKPFPILGKIKPSPIGLGKWLGYVDRFFLFIPSLKKAVSWADIIHICDQANAVYLPLVKEKPHVVTCHDVIAIQNACGDFYENTIKCFSQPDKNKNKLVSNWIQTEVLRILSERNISINELNLSANNLSELIELFASEKISSRIAKDIFPEIISTGKNPNTIIKEKNLIQVSDDALIESIVKKIIDENPDNVQKYKNGKNNLFGFFVGQVMKETQGKANPKIINKFLEKYLS